LGGSGASAPFFVGLLGLAKRGTAMGIWVMVALLGGVWLLLSD
jgi:hypothetical protein